jgi:type I restriction enzyme, S subunit
VVISNYVNVINDSLGFSQKLPYISTDGMIPYFGGVLPQFDEIPSNSHHFQPGDILLSNIRPYFRKLWMASFEGLCSPDVICLRSKDPSILVPAFLFYYLSSETFFKRYIKGCIGSKMPRGNKDVLLNFPIKLPSFEQQEHIVDIIGSIDSKIDNVGKTERILWKESRSIFNFMFSRSEENFESEDYPLVENTGLQYGYPLSTSLFSENEGRRVIRIRDIPSLTTSAFSIEPVDEKYLSEPGDLLIGMDGNFHMNFWYEKGDIINQRITRIRSKDVSNLLIFLEIQPIIKLKEKSVAKSTVGHLSDEDFKGLKIRKPKNQKMNAIFDDILSRIVLCEKEKKISQGEKNTLLPLLINEQIN